MDPARGLQWPEKKDSLHAGWMATFKHPMNFRVEELKRPCVGATAAVELHTRTKNRTGVQHLCSTMSMVWMPPAGQHAAFQRVQ